MRDNTAASGTILERANRPRLPMRRQVQPNGRFHNARRRVTKTGSCVWRNGHDRQRNCDLCKEIVG